MMVLSIHCKKERKKGGCFVQYNIQPLFDIRLIVVTDLRHLCGCSNQTRNDYGIQQLQE